MIDPDMIYTTKEVAAFLGCTTNTVHVACRAGQLASFRVGDGLKAPFRILGAAVIQYLTRRARPPGAHGGVRVGAGRSKRGVPVQAITVTYFSRGVSLSACAVLTRVVETFVFEPTLVMSGGDVPGEAINDSRLKSGVPSTEGL